MNEPDDLPTRPVKSGKTPGAAFPGRTIEDKCAHWLAARKSFSEGLISQADLDEIETAFDQALDEEFHDLWYTPNNADKDN